MDVVFVLPRWSRVPVGGYQMVYAHANALAARGHTVSVLHWAAVSAPRWRGPAAELWRRTRSGGQAEAPAPWYDHHPGVRVRPVLALPKRWPAGTAVVATSWQTSEAVARAAAPGWGFSYLQSHETWSGPADQVDASWRLPLHKLVIARWLAARAGELGTGPVDHVPNFVDETFFVEPRPPVVRQPGRVAMLWHEHPVKGSDVGVAALELARDQDPLLRASVFAVYERPAQLPAWIDWFARPTRAELVQLLRSSQVFVSPSRMEGWALPPAEAMAAGCALVATDIGGHQDYAEHDVTAWLVPAEDPRALAAGVLRLLRDPALSARLVHAGNARVRQFTREASAAAFEHALLARAGTVPMTGRTGSASSHAGGAA
jgi:glycosyltransferase involved in cell wall biosynthesis